MEKADAGSATKEWQTTWLAGVLSFHLFTGQYEKTVGAHSMQQAVHNCRGMSISRATNRHYQSSGHCGKTVSKNIVKNAFNSAQRQHIISSLSQLNVPTYIQLTIRDYFVGKKHLYDTDEGPVDYLVYGKVPQESVLGQLLRNIICDHALCIKLSLLTDNSQTY